MNLGEWVQVAYDLTEQKMEPEVHVQILAKTECSLWTLGRKILFFFLPQLWIK